MASTSIVIRTNRRYPIPDRAADSLVLDLLPTVAASTMNANLEQLVERAGALPAAARELLLLASAVYIADKVTPRDDAPDRWTRSFTIDAPASDPALWETAAPDLPEALQFLTGDHWDLRWRQEVTTIHRVRPRMRSRYDAVCLFSGGLDSFAGAIDLLEDPARPRVLLIGHYDSMHTPGPQRRLANALGVVYGQARLRLLQIRVRPAPLSQAQAVPLTGRREPSTRSRSLLFIALGIAAAAAIGSHVPLYVPENGFIALNVPLIRARLGSCSTRTTHPYFLDRLRVALGSLGLTNPIHTPYASRTKGEMLATSRNPDLLTQHARETVSCAHPEAGRYVGARPGNCGYCFPCLIRRGALHAVGADVAADYQWDVTSDMSLFEGTSARGQDARALFMALLSSGDPLRDPTLAPLVAGPLPPEVDRRAAARVYQQGMAELRAWLMAQASDEVRRFAGLEGD